MGFLKPKVKRPEIKEPPEAPKDDELDPKAFEGIRRRREEQKKRRGRASLRIPLNTAVSGGSKSGLQIS